MDEAVWFIVLRTLAALGKTRRRPCADIESIEELRRRSRKPASPPVLSTIDPSTYPTTSLSSNAIYQNGSPISRPSSSSKSASQTYRRSRSSFSASTDPAVKHRSAPSATPGTTGSDAGAASAELWAGTFRPDGQHRCVRPFPNILRRWTYGETYLGAASIQEFMLTGFLYSGVAVGSTIGHALGGLFSGGSSSSAPAETQQVQTSQSSEYQQPAVCANEVGNFQKCMNQNQVCSTSEQGLWEP
jgi:hypothetical protein